jgi:nucleoside-diphosphate-sugar epimerase
LRILVTGARGLIGSQLVPELERRGHEVTGVGRADGDLSDPGVADRLVAEHEPEAVVHLAARVGRVVGEQDPAGTVRDNATAALLVARACAAHGTRLALGSTSEVYGPGGDGGLGEDAPGSLPDSVYGLSKHWAEEAARLFCPDALLLRFVMPYGPGVAPGQGKAALVNMLDQARSRRPIVVYRGGERSFCFVTDVGRAVALLVEGGHTGAWNVGRDDAATPMVEIARIACRLADAPPELIEEVDPPNPDGVVHRISTAKLRALGWQPEVGLEEGMRATLDWLASRAT